MGEMKAALNAGRSTIFRIKPDDPENEVRLILDPKHPLYDARAKEDPPDEFVASVAFYGVLKPIFVVKGESDGGKTILFVIDGRKRFLAWRKANAMLRERGAPEKDLPVIIKKGEVDEKTAAVDLIGIMAAANIYVPDAPMNVARKAAAAMNAGMDEARVAADNGLTVAGLRQHIKLLEAPAAIKRAVEKGEVSVTAALALAKRPEAEQKEVLSAPPAETKDGRKKRKVSVAKAKGKTKAGLERRDAVAALKKMDASMDAGAKAELGSAMGDFRSGVLHALRWVVEGKMSDALAELLK